MMNGFVNFYLNQFKIDIENFSNVLDPSIDGNRFTQNYNFDVGFLYRVKSYFAAFNASNILPKQIDQAMIAVAEHQCLCLAH